MTKELEAIYDQQDDFSIKVKVEDDESITIDWDEAHPIAIEMGMSHWTPEDWIQYLQEYLEVYPNQESEAVAE